MSYKINIPFEQWTNEFTFFWKSFFCKDLIVKDYILILEDFEKWIEKILKESNKEFPNLNERQKENFYKIIFWADQKDIKSKEKIEEKKTKEKMENALENFLFLEWTAMHFFHLSLKEIREMPYIYFINLIKQIWPILWENKDDKNEKPDKKSFKKEFWNLYK